MLRSHDTTMRRLNDGITFDDAVGGDYARQLWDYPHDGPPWKAGGISTVLPADAITIDGRLYLFSMVNRGLHNVLWTEINYSDDCGDTWHDAGPDARRLGSHQDGHQQLVTWEHDPDTGWVYVIASAFNRSENAFLYRCAPTRFSTARHGTHGPADGFAAIRYPCCPRARRSAR